MKKILFFALALFAVMGAYAQEKIAVFPFEDRGNVFSNDDAYFFYRQFSNVFSEKTVGIFDVLPRVDVDKLFNTEEAFQLTRFSEKVKTAEIEKALNGRRILSGVIGKRGNTIRISISLYTFPDFIQLSGGIDLDVANTDELFKKIPELVQRMRDAIGGTNDGTEQTNTTQPQNIWEQLVNATGNTTITVTQDAVFRGAKIVNASSITLHGDVPGRTLYSPDEKGYAIHVEKGVTLTLENITFKNIQIWVKEGGTLVMNDAAIITGCDSSGVDVNGMFTMNGGTISNNSNCGVDVNGTFTMNGGTISNNSNCGVYVNGGNFTMRNGNIENNNGGGVHVSGNFNMYGGTIAGNRAGSSGGGVYVIGGNFNMSGGSIAGNRAGSNGGGVEVMNGNFYMSGGSIAGNRAGSYGGGLCVHYGNNNFSKTGGTIYGSNGGANANHASKKGDASYEFRFFIDQVRNRNY